MRSLRVRLLVIVGSVAAIAVITVVLVSRVGIRTEFRRYETKTRELAVEDAAGALQAWLDAGGDPLKSGEVLHRFDRPGEGSLALVDSAGRVLSTSAPSLDDATIQLDQAADKLEILRGKLEGDQRRVERVEIRGAPRAPIVGPDGRSRGFVVGIPSFEIPEGPAAPYVRSVNRWMIGAVAVAALLALIITWFLSRRIVGPVEALTGAARRMERGDWTARVTVRGNDEIGALAGAFNAMADALGRNEALRRQMVSDAAHELRTPLTNLRAQLEAIEDGIVPADPDTIRSLHEEAMLLSRLVGDLQELSVAESGGLRLDRLEIRPREALESATAAFRSQAEAAGVSLEIAPSAGDLPTVSADPARLAQILRNLIANALTHTPRGGRVTLSAAREAGVGAAGEQGRAPAATGGGLPDASAVRFEVRDTGAGIAPEHLSRVFDRFYRADASRSRSTGGAGLGLSIVKHLVEAHGGRVAVSSKPGSGTVVSFTIPVRAPQA